MVRIDRFTDGDLEIEVIPELGARIHRIRASGQDVMRTPADPETHRGDPFFWGGYVMAPWCNRVEPGPTEVGGRLVALGPNFRDGTAIHGQVYSAPWTAEDDGRYTIHAGGDGWPWPYEASVRYAVSGSTVEMELRVTNLADESMPAGIGIHPWFMRPLEIAIHADSVFTSNLASSREPMPVSGAYDLRQLGTMADDLDGTWADLADPAAVLRWPDTGLTMTMRAGPTASVIVAASPHDIDAVAVEPETHAPQALRRLRSAEPFAPAWLDPGTSLVLEASLGFTRSGRDEPPDAPATGPAPA